MDHSEEDEEFHDRDFLRILEKMKHYLLLHQESEIIRVTDCVRKDIAPRLEEIEKHIKRLEAQIFLEKNFELKTVSKEKSSQ